VCADTAFSCRMCNAAFQCPGQSRCGAMHFDDVTGQCVCATECTNGAVELPPGMAIGRPFLSAKAAPMLAPALEQSASDWVTLL
jgi:hypothetical protein